MPGIIFGYTSDTPIVDDGSQVATVVWPNLSEHSYMGAYTLVAIDGIPFPARARNSPFRMHDAACFAVDLLPGRHTLTFSYQEYFYTGQGRRTYSISSPYPSAVSADFEAGTVYQLRAELSGGAFVGFSIDGDLSDPGIVERLDSSRSTFPMAYTPLAGSQGGGQTLAQGSAPQRRTVQPAAPRVATAPEPAQSSSRRTVQPAAPRRTVQPAAPRSQARQTQPAPALAAAAPELSPELTDDIAFVHIYRVGQMAGAAIGYDIHLEDQVVWRARNKSKATIRLDREGIAALWAKTESRVDLPIDIQLGNEYWVRCGLRMGAFVGRPDLQLMDAATGRAEFERVDVTAQVIDLTTADPPAPMEEPEPESEPESIPEPEPSPDTLAATVPPPAPAPETVPRPLPDPIGNGTIEIMLVALPDSVMFRPAPEVIINPKEMNIDFIGDDGSKWSPRYFYARGRFGVSTDGLTYRNDSEVTVRLAEAPAGFRPQRMVFTVSGNDKGTFDLIRGRWADESQEQPPAPVETPVAAMKPSPWDAVSSAWDGDNFTVELFLRGPSTDYNHGKWAFIIRPPFPHAITGLDDSYVQTALGIALINKEPSAAVEWFLRAARQDFLDGIMLLATAYANVNKVKNTTEAERWFRRAEALGNTTATARLAELRAGKPVGSFTIEHSYSSSSLFLE
jgi:hypothetical protein